jgi:quercetin dioxygenase-like cupin family protein
MSHQPSQPVGGNQQQIVAPTGGFCYEWMSDVMFVKLTGAQTGGLFTLVQDNLKPGFNLGLHIHKAHAETFYILAGDVEFVVGSETIRGEPGMVVHVPAGVPHSLRSEQPAKMLMIYCPAGFELALEEMKRLTEEQGKDPELMRKLNERFDIFFLDQK